MVKNTKTWIFWEFNITFLWNKKILNLCLRWHNLRSYCFAVQVTFNDKVKIVDWFKNLANVTSILHSTIEIHFNLNCFALAKNVAADKDIIIETKAMQKSNFCISLETETHK